MRAEPGGRVPTLKGPARLSLRSHRRRLSEFNLHPLIWPDPGLRSTGMETGVRRRAGRRDCRRSLRMGDFLHRLVGDKLKLVEIKSASRAAENHAPHDPCETRRGLLIFLGRSPQHWLSATLPGYWNLQNIHPNSPSSDPKKGLFPGSTRHE